MATPPPPTTTGVIPLSAERWTTVYHGYGSVSYDAQHGIVLSPKAPTVPSETHAALTLAISFGSETNSTPLSQLALALSISTLRGKGSCRAR